MNCWGVEEDTLYFPLLPQCHGDCTVAVQVEPLTSCLTVTWSDSEEPAAAEIG